MRFIYSALLLLLLGCGTQQIREYQSENTEISSIYSSNELDTLIQPYKDEMDESMNRVIGTAEVNLENGDPESTLGNFAADVVYEAGVQYGKSTKSIGPDAMKRTFCMLNFGGLRAPINQGTITVGNVFELMPFDNTLTIVRLKGEEMKELLAYVMEAHGQPISGAKMQLSSNDYKIFLNGELYDFKDDVYALGVLFMRLHNYF